MNLTPEQVKQEREAVSRCPDCSDFDEDCADIPDKVHCYVYAPERGMCPYLRAAGQKENEG